MITKPNKTYKSLHPESMQSLITIEQIIYDEQIHCKYTKYGKKYIMLLVSIKQKI